MASLRMKPFLGSESRFLLSAEDNANYFCEYAFLYHQMDMLEAFRHFVSTAPFRLGRASDGRLLQRHHATSI